MNRNSVRWKLFSALMVLLTGVAFAAAPFVSSTSPQRNSKAISASSNITITFDQSMNNTTLTPSTIVVFGSMSGKYSGSFSFGTNTATFDPDSNFKAGEVITVSVTTGAQNNSAEGLVRGYVFQFTVDASQGYAKFKSPVHYTAHSSYAGDIETIAADFDKDGDVDLATSLTIENKIAVFFNNGNGTYASPVNLSGYAPRDLKAADVDGDGDLDLVTANYSAMSVYVFKNNGDGTFAAKQDYSFAPYPQSYAYALAVGDVDGDGDIDAAQVDALHDSLYILLNNGTGAYTSNAPIALTNRFNKVAIADYDGDLDMDVLISSSNSNEVRWYSNNGTGTLTYDGGAALGSVYINHFAVADLDGDLKMDAFTANSSTDQINVRTDFGGVPLLNGENFSAGDYPYAVASADLDSDNDLDLLVANYNDQNVAFLKNNGSASFSSYTAYPVGYNTVGVLSADVNKDGTMDVVTTNNNGTISVLMNYNGGHVVSITPANSAINIDSTSNITVVFDENINSGTLTSSTVKIVGSISGAHSWALSSYNSGTYTAIFNPSTSFAPGEVVTVTVSNGVQNGNAVALENGFASSFVVEAAAAGTFGSTTSYAAGTQPKSVLLSDLNADGYADLVAVNSGGNSVSVRLNTGSGTYGSEAVLSTGTNPTSAAAGDVDGDGDIDLVVTVTGADQLARFLNNGSGVFGTATTFTTSAGPNGVALADLDGDGDLDVAYSRSSQMMTQLNNGSGTFSNEWGWNSGNSGIAIADVDNDGDLDVIAPYANSIFSKVYIYKNGYSSSYGGWGYLATNVNYSVDNDPTGVVAADFNNDGYVDVVTTNLASGNGTINYLANNQNGTFAAAVAYTVATSATPRGISAVDIDSDGDLDLAVANSAGSTAVVFTNNGSGTFAKVGTYSTGSNPYAVAAADIDADGDMDVATANYGGDNVSILKATTLVQISSKSPADNDVDVAVSSNVVVTFNQAMNAGTLNSSTIIVSGSQRGRYTGTYGHSSGVMTFNPDSNFKAGEFITVLVKTGVQNPDGAALPASYRWTFVAAASAEGAFGSKQNYSLYGNPRQNASADIDGDGDLDVVNISTQWHPVNNHNASRVEVTLNNGSGVLGSSDTTYLGSYYAKFLSVADLDADGDIDLVIANENSNSFTVVFNNGNGTFAAPVVTAIADPYPTLAIGDMNNDGSADLVFAKYNSNQAVVYLNNGSGSFTPQSPMTTGAGPWGVQVGDVNGDGYADIITANYDANTLSVFQNNGDGTFAAAASVNTGIIYPDGIAIGDLDSDGDADLAVSAWDDGKISVLLNTGTGTFSAATAYTNHSPSQIKLGDMDGDDDLDVVTSEPGSGKIYIRANNGSGSFSAPAAYTAGSYPQSLTLADVDGDGDLDIATANNGNSTVSIIKNIELVKVNSTSPTANALDVDKTSNVTVTFNTDINSATLVDSTVIVNGSINGKIDGVISYDSPSKTMTFNPTSNFTAGEKVSITVTTNIKSASGINLLNPYSASFTVHVAGNGNFTYKDTIPDYGSSFYTMSSLVAGDATGDGKEDIFGIFNNGLIKVFKNNTTSFDSISNVSIAIPYQMPLADLDNDGDIDMVHKSSGNEITVLLNDGLGNYSAQTPFNPGINNPPAIVLKDIDNDGKVDIMLQGGGGAQMYVFYNTGAGNFSTSVYSVINTHYDVMDYAAADVDNDGNNEIIAVHSGNGNNFVTIIPNTGDRSYGTPVDYTIAEGAKKILALNVNGDGAVDIVTANQGGKHLSILLNNGNGTLASAVNYSTGLRINQIAGGDIDGDGDVDMLIRGIAYNASWDSDQDFLTLAYNNGSGNFGNQLSIDIKSDAPIYYSSYSDLSLLDIDNDNDLDFVIKAHHYYGANQYSNILEYENIAGSSTAPTTAATSVATSNLSGTTATISWTSGNGSRRLVLVKQGGAVSATPSDNGNFTPSDQFGSGTHLSSGNYVVYGGNGSSINISGLTKNTTYHIAVFEINGTPGNERVLATSAPTASFTTTQFDGPFDQTPGYALNFDGRWNQTSNYVNLSDSFTVEMWVKPSAIGSAMTMLVQGNNEMFIGINSSGNFFARVNDDGGGDRPIHNGESKKKQNTNQAPPLPELSVDFTGSTTTAVANQWYHVALTAKSGESAKLYVNGTLEATSATISTVYSSGYFYLGGDYNDATFTGRIDELRLWGSVRTESEIRANLHKTFEGIPANLNNYWQFNEGTGNTSDELVNANNMIGNSEGPGNLLWVTSDVPVGGGSSSNTSVAANTTGLQTVGNVALNMTNGFDNPTDVVVSEVSVAPSSYPTNYSSSVGNKYFIIDAFPYPDSGSFSATLTLSYGAGVLTDNLADNYILYKRSSSSSGAWTSYGSATSVNISTGEVTWTGIASFSQAIVVNTNTALPVELGIFTATTEAGKVHLNWKTMTESNNAGFEVQRSIIDAKGTHNDGWKKIGYVEGSGTSNAPKEYSFVDASARGSMRYRLKQIDRDGRVEYSRTIEVSIAAPLVFALDQNYPNPFNPSTTIGFTIPQDGMTTLKIYNAVGQEVATLVNEQLKSGEYHQAVFNAQNLASGVYFARLNSGGKMLLKKMLLLK